MLWDTVTWYLTDTVYLTLLDTVIVEVDCETGEECLNIIECPIYAPNAFTPDGDSVNDVWFVEAPRIVGTTWTSRSTWGRFGVGFELVQRAVGRGLRRGVCAGRRVHIPLHRSQYLHQSVGGKERPCSGIEMIIFRG